MANYLPVLLVSVAAGVPDDAALQSLPRGQVDYLSHDWAEEDVARSWRSMTKQKNEIANGLRLENASWRTWWKQRNKLKTVSPETLNWLKDSDVTWLYGPLHTALDWAPPKPPSTATSSTVPSPSSGSPPTSASTSPDRSTRQSKTKGVMKKSSTSTSLSSPSSSSALDRYGSARGLGPAYYSQVSGHTQVGSSYERSGERPTVMKPILKHRSISEMLTSALPPSPIFAHFVNSVPDSDVRETSTCRPAEDNVVDAIDASRDEEGRVDNNDYSRRATLGSTFGRPPMFHTRSDTNILPRFGAGKRNNGSSPRVAPSAIALDHVHERLPDNCVDVRPPASPTTANGGSSMFTAQQRIGAVGNLVDLATSSHPSISASTSSAAGANVSALSTDTRNRPDSSAGVCAFPGTADTQGSLLRPSSPLQMHLGVSMNSSKSVGITSNGDSQTVYGAEETSPTSIAGSTYISSTIQQHPHVSSQTQSLPQKKHISFNAIVEQYIAIDGGTPDAVDLDVDLGIGQGREQEEDGELDIGAGDEDELGALGVRMMKRYWKGEDSDNGYEEEEEEEDGMYEDVDVEADPILHAHADHQSRGYEWEAQEELRRCQQATASKAFYGRPRIQDNDDDDDDADDDDDDEVLEMRTPSRRNSSGSLNLNASRKSIEFSDNLASYGLDAGVFESNSQRPSRVDQPKRARFRRTTNKPHKSAHNLRSTFSGSGSGSGSGSNSRSRSGGGHGHGYGSAEREHVTIAPIAPTVLKVDERDGEEANPNSAYTGYGGYGAYGAYGEEGVVYVNSIPVSIEAFSNTGHGEYAYGSSPYSAHTPLPSASSHTSGYGYGGYGFGEQVSAGRDLIREGFEQGRQDIIPNDMSHLSAPTPTNSTRGEPGELVYQAPDGSVHPWSEQEAIRFRTQLEFGGNISPAGTSPVSGSPPVRGGQIVFPPSVVGRSHVNGGVLGQPFVSSPAQLKEVENDYFAGRTEETGSEGFCSGGRESQSESVVPSYSSRAVQLASGRISPQQLSPERDQRKLQPYTVESIRRERDRTPSPDYLGAPITNPRVATLRTELFHGSSPPSTSSSHDVPFVQSSPTLAIPVPAQSNSHQDQDSAYPNGTNYSPSESPTTRVLSPENSPRRGRSPIPVSASGSTTSAPSSTSSSSFDARSLSASRSDSRRRSRTRNSSLSASSDMELERGRSRSRSTNCSGAASPLSDSSSPNTRRLPSSEAAMGGLAIGGGVGHSGREIRDGRGVRLYRKTSEDCIGRAEERGRSCESKRVRLSESLSPPTMGSGSTGPGTSAEGKVYGGYYKASYPSSLHTSTTELDNDGKQKASTQGTILRPPAKQANLQLNNAVAKRTTLNLTDKFAVIATDYDSSPAFSGLGSEPSPAAGSLRNSGTSREDSASASGSSTISDGRTLPTCIPEEDEQLPRSDFQKIADTPTIPLPSTPGLTSNHPLLNNSVSPVLSKVAADIPRSGTVSGINTSSRRVHSGAVSSGSISISPQRPRSSDVPLPSITRVVKASSGGPSSPAVTPAEAQGTGTFANRAADIMSSARNLLGTIWNGSVV